MLEKCKPLFVGNEQHDAQEFLSEILDSLHEDVNRVLVKPQIPPPEDQVWDSWTRQVCWGGVVRGVGGDWNMIYINACMCAYVCLLMCILPL